MVNLFKPFSEAAVYSIAISELAIGSLDTNFCISSFRHGILDGHLWRGFERRVKPHCAAGLWEKCRDGCLPAARIFHSLRCSPFIPSVQFRSALLFHMFVSACSGWVSSDEFGIRPTLTHLLMTRAFNTLCKMIFWIGAVLLFSIRTYRGAITAGSLLREKYFQPRASFDSDFLYFLLNQTSGANCQNYLVQLCSLLDSADL